jgi:hypothetical protein
VTALEEVVHSKTNRKGIVNVMTIVELYLVNSVGKWGIGPNVREETSLSRVWIFLHLLEIHVLAVLFFQWHLVTTAGERITAVGFPFLPPV